LTETISSEDRKLRGFHTYHATRSIQSVPQISSTAARNSLSGRT
jgi:hypothetical protein